MPGRGGWARLGIVLLVAAALHVSAPPTTRRAAAPALQRTADLVHAELPGGAPPSLASSTLPPALLAAAIFEVGYRARSRGDETRAAHLERVSGALTLALRVAWCLLAGLGALLAAELAMWSGRRWSSWAGGFTLLACLASPGAAFGISHLSPSIPAGLLLVSLGLRLSAHGKAGAWIDGWMAGALLAWFPFAWPVVPLFLAWRPGGRLPRITTAAAALLFTLALNPGLLTAPGTTLARCGQEWIREGGWPLHVTMPRLGSIDVLLAGNTLGSWTIPLTLGALLLRGRVLRDPVWGWVASVLVACAAVPALLGAITPGAAQGMALFVLAAAASAAFLGLAGARLTRVAAVGLALASLSGVLITRMHATSRAQSTADLGAEMRSVLTARVGEREPWLSDRPLPDGLPLPGRALLLPRDSMTPGRFDWASWPGWYGGFRHVLLSAAQVRENLGRADAILPRALYRAIETHGRLVASWGDGERGFRLYQMPDEGEWARPLEDGDFHWLEQLPELDAFIGNLGAVYAGAGDLVRAGTILRAGIRLYPDAPGLWNNLGLVHLAAQDARSAAEALEEGLRHAPRSVELLYNAARAYMALGSFPRAEGYLRLAIAREPEYPPLHRELARAFLEQKKHHLALMAFRRYLELQPDADDRASIEAVIRQLASSGEGVDE